MMIYLDSAATTLPYLDVSVRVKDCLSMLWSNPSSLYKKSNYARKVMDESRKKVADFINAEKEEIIFTSGGSESNCMAIQGFVTYCKTKGITPSIITSTIEHKSIIECVETVAEDLYFVGVDKNGFVNLETLKNILNVIPKNNAILVSIQYANNEIGTIQDIKSIAELVHSYSGILHTDAVQAFGHEYIDVKELGIDMLSASGHKIGMYKGSGILYKKNSVNIKPIIFGSQEGGLRGGTENVPFMAGFAKAVEISESNMTEYQLRTSILRNNFINELKALGCVINGSLDKRLCNNISIILPEKVSGEETLYMLETNDIYVSTGSACNSKSIEPSYVLKAIGLSDAEARRTIRISLPDDFETDDIDKVICELRKIITLMQSE